MSEATATSLPDVHAERDRRGIALPQVGVRRLACTLTVEDPAEAFGPLCASASLHLRLDGEQRGAHLSRFSEALEALGGRLSVARLPELLREIAARLQSPAAGVRVEFPLLFSRAAPVSGARGEVRVDCAIEGTLSDGAVELTQEVSLWVQTVCPCSRAISERGAHNQRCRIQARLTSEGGLSFRRAVELLEAQGSAQVYPALKRVDEKQVTEAAYDHACFVEDVARSAVEALRRWPEVRRFRVEAESQESIHPHDAFAVADGP